MRGFVGARSLLLLLAVTVSPSAAQVVTTLVPDTSSRAIFRRAQRMVNDGQGVEGRALVDSMLNAAEPRTPAEAEALYWRATLAESWESAQRDYLRLMLEHERSPRSGDAMLRLAQGEVARGDREAAVRYLERLAREAPESAARTEASLWHGRLLVELGDSRAGCGMLRDARPRVPAGAIELENQFDYVLRACPDTTDVAAPVTAAPPAGAPPAPVVAPPVTAPVTAPVAAPAQSTPTRPPATAPAAPVRAWSFQVAALGILADANALVARLKERGYEARVDTRTAPFKVRVGRYPSMAAAAAAMNAYKSKERGDAFVLEVPPGSF